MIYNYLNILTIMSLSGDNATKTNKQAAHSQNASQAFNGLPRFSILANLCRSAGFFLQGSAKIVALSLEDPYRSARYLQKCADFL